MKYPVVETEDFTIYLEDVDGYIFIHCDVFSKWSKEVKKKLQWWFNRLTETHNKELFALHSPEDTKHEKFLKMFGFEYLRSIVGTDDNNYDIYIWR